MTGVLLAVCFRRSCTAQPVDARFFHFLAPSAHEVPHQRPSPFPYYRSSLETHRFVHTLIPTTTDNILRLFCRSVFIVNNNRFYYLIYCNSFTSALYTHKSVSRPAFCFVLFFSQTITTFDFFFFEKFRFSLHDEIVLLRWLFGCSGRHRRRYFQFKKHLNSLNYQILIIEFHD